MSGIRTLSRGKSVLYGPYDDVSWREVGDLLFRRRGAGCSLPKAAVAKAGLVLYVVLGVALRVVGVVAKVAAIVCGGLALVALWPSRRRNW
jgi:hypothetical protein